MADPMLNLKALNAGFSTLGLREVVPDQTGIEHWKELSFNTGRKSVNIS